MASANTTPTAIIDRILSSKNPFLKLGLPIQPTEPPTVRVTYKALALLIHPDKCKLPRATQAFAALSDAFEILYDVELQQKCLRTRVEGSQKPGRCDDEEQDEEDRKHSAKGQKRKRPAKASPKWYV